LRMWAPQNRCYTNQSTVPRTTMRIKHVASMPQFRNKQHLLWRFILWNNYIKPPFFKHVAGSQQTAKRNSRSSAPGRTFRKQQNRQLQQTWRIGKFSATSVSLNSPSPGWLIDCDFGAERMNGWLDQWLQHNLVWWLGLVVWGLWEIDCLLMFV
jgi:hypothetical protein